MRLSAIVRAATLSAALFAGNAGAVPNLVENGGFESGGFPPSWTVVGNATFMSVEDDGNSLSGQYAARLGPTGVDSHLTQLIPTTPGMQYVIELFLANLTTSDPIDNHVSVSFDEVLLYEASDLDTQNQYMRLVLTGIASGPSTLLDLAVRNEPSFFYLDDVSLTVAVPEPNSLGLLLVGLAGLAAARRRNRSFQDF